MRFSKIDSGLRWILIIAGIKLLFHLVLNAVDSYGIFRDEYYYLACADHLAFGYVDHPALSIFLLWIERGLLGDSLFAIRILPAFAGAVTVVFGGLIAREFGGCTFAQVLTALMIFAIPGFLGINSFYSMNSFDVLVWSIALYIVAMLANGGTAYYWYILGLVLGLGLMNKISVLWLSAGIFIGLITTRHRSMFKATFPWTGAIIALLLFSPYLIWQIVYQWPTLEFIRNATTYKLQPMNPLEFMVAVAFEINPLLFPIWVTGLVYLFVSKETKLHRWAGIFWLVVMGILVFSGSAKSYYANPSFPVPIATGALAIERLVDRGKKWRWVPPVTVVYTVIALLIAMPFAVPVLPVQDYISFARKTGMNLETGEQNEQGVLPQFFADRFGWEELAQKTAAVYQALPDSDKTDCVIFTTNYGRAASLEYYTEEYDLPPVICGHNSYWHWGPGDYNGKVMIVVDNQGQERLGEFFEETEEKGRTNHPLSMPYEQNVHIYVCRNLREPLKAIWPILKIFI